jgi:hypothetical protein
MGVVIDMRFFRHLSLRSATIMGVNFLAWLSLRSKNFLLQSSPIISTLVFLKVHCQQTLVFWTYVNKNIKSNGCGFSWSFIARKKQQTTHHKENDSVNRKSCINKNITSLGRGELVSLGRRHTWACLNVVADNYGCISCSWNFHLKAPSLL